jgi:hypothetical protein
MGFKLVDEVLDHAPAELTTPERFLLVLLAKAARDEARTCWPGMDTLARQMGISERRVRQLLNQLAQRGYEVRVPSGVDKNGMPVFASKGHATVYRLPVFDPAKGEEPCRLSTPERGKHSAAFGDGKGGSSRSQRRKDSVAKAVGVLPPFSQEPSGEPSDPRARADEVAAVIGALRDRTGKTVNEHHAGLVVDQLLAARRDGEIRTTTVRYLTGAIRRDANPGRFLPVPDLQSARELLATMNPLNPPPRSRKEDHQ